MKRRGLLSDAAPKEQFAALRQIPSLTQAQCRDIVSLLSEEDNCKRTCSKIDKVHVDAFPCLRTLQVPSHEEAPLTVWCMSLQDILEAKLRTCPLFAACVSNLFKKNGRSLPLIFYADDSQGGNVLAPMASRKSTLVYCTFLGMELLHLETLWITLSVIKASEAASCPGGLCSIMTALMTFYEKESRNGLALTLEGEAELILLPYLVFLSDHEGVRASVGCKGASGIRPCVKCRNCLSQGRATSVDGYEDLSQDDFSAFRKQTHEQVEEALMVLRAQPTRKAREEAEKLLGFNFENLERGPLAQPQLRSFFRLENIQYDSLHHYFSSGLICQELGLWFSTLKHNIGTDVLEHMRKYMSLTWTPMKGGCKKAQNPANFCSEKLWKLDQDFRGDASACWEMLPLAVCYGEV